MSHIPIDTIMDAITAPTAATTASSDPQTTTTTHDHSHHHDHDHTHEDHDETTTTPNDGKKHACVCVHTHDSDASDDEEDTEPGKSDPINEYDPDIDYIDLTNDRLMDIGDITKCSKLEEIVLRQNKLSNNILEQLNHCHALQRIDLYENRLTPIPRGTNVLQNLQQLEDLDLSFNELRFTRGLSNLKALKSLYLIQNKIQVIGKEINTISDNITMLELGSNRLRVLENLDNFQQLEQLFVGRNKIAAIGPNSLQNMPKLRLLSLQSNRILKLENLDGVSGSLEELYMSHNGLTKIEGLEKCSKMRVLDLSNNYLTDVDADQLAHMTDLEELWLNNNKITTWDWLHKLKGLKNLTTIYLEHNPCSGDVSAVNHAARQAYVLKIREILPQVKQIDADYYE